MLAREETMESGALKGELHKILPVVDTRGSDSSMLDNTLEFLVMSGMELPLAMMIAIPEPWSKMPHFLRMSGILSVLCDYDGAMGRSCFHRVLRRRYHGSGSGSKRSASVPLLCDENGDLILASEVGVLDVPEEEVVLKERLHPGKMLLVDTVKGKIYQDEELKEMYTTKQPYGEWLDSNLVELKDLKIPNMRVEEYEPVKRKQLQKAFGYTYEEYRNSIRNMALNGGESIAAMGVDTPLAVLSDKRRPLFDYFKQLFAQVTNPPIDAIREEIVTCTTVYAGKQGNLLEEKEENCRVLKINNPILTNTDMLKIKK